MNTYTIDSYTGKYDAAMRPSEPEAGEVYRVPEDPNGSGQTTDGREWDAFRRLLSAAGLVGEYSHTEDGWDYYDLIIDLDADVRAVTERTPQAMSVRPD